MPARWHWLICLQPSEAGIQQVRHDDLFPYTVKNACYVAEIAMLTFLLMTVMDFYQRDR